MAKQAWIPFLAQLVLVFVGARMTPDYNSRTPESVMRWAYTRGIWILIASAVLTAALLYLAGRTKSPWAWTAAVVSSLLTLVWLLRPIFFSILGDLVLWRFP